MVEEEEGEEGEGGEEFWNASLKDVEGVFEELEENRWTVKYRMSMKEIIIRRRTIRNQAEYDRCRTTAIRVINSREKDNLIPSVLNYILDTQDVFVRGKTVIESYAKWSENMTVVERKQHLFLRG